MAITDRLHEEAPVESALPGIYRDFGSPAALPDWSGVSSWMACFLQGLLQAFRSRRTGAEAMSTIATKERTKIFHKDWGAGQPVVFSHGWPVTAEAWDPQMVFLG